MSEKAKSTDRTYTADDCGHPIRLGRFVFQLEEDVPGRMRTLGPRNRWWLQVDGHPDTPKAELEQLAQQIAALPKLIAAARKAEAVMSKHIYPQPDKAGTPSESLKELREALKALDD